MSEDFVLLELDVYRLLVRPSDVKSILLGYAQNEYGEDCWDEDSRTIVITYQCQGKIKSMSSRFDTPEEAKSAYDKLMTVLNGNK